MAAMVTKMKWCSGVDYISVAERMVDISLGLGWQTQPSMDGIPALRLNISGRQADGYGTLVNTLVRKEDVLAWSPRLANAESEINIAWDLWLRCGPAGFPQDKGPLIFSTGIRGGAAWLEERWINSELLKLAWCDVGVNLYLRNVTGQNLALHLAAYELLKELWHAFGADTCYACHEDVMYPNDNYGNNVLFQFSRVEPVRLLLPLEERRLPTAEELDQSATHPGPWFGAQSVRLDLEPGDWDWKPKGLANLGLPKSKEEWERSGLPLAST